MFDKSTDIIFNSLNIECMCLTDAQRVLLSVKIMLSVCYNDDYE